ncbi:polyprenol phosphomannose-dependent alpha 1,6 mannosyltransferase MptB [Streptomyces sp. DSM 41527]|uniref:Polyprenol phosphomannose-dependent alpha 1,6 mannosyltransferase MptB n=1 Tax=Streptomyces mooreae TaxID=3075523 RepID=A0ABU2T387_9ACTN|nr:polyprenol phosphomannose-dependent alpha 1,6 mannosyltransferase MptB [Streptomyces sp. DSM 41527]MDT0455697.1 polyprenol phosphomannose-dependent alpha 1,6 mannosyltransferase MptB [Streptomyces sp. DSM 41527]
MSAAGSTVRAEVLLGTLGSALLGVGGWGSGALPRGVPDGVWGRPGEPLQCVGVAVSYAGLVLLIAAWWRLGRRVADGTAGGWRPLRRALWCWVLPLVPGPLLGSSDAYSYLAQGALAGRGRDVYALGPAALGGPLAANVPGMWHDTPAPYGPLSVAAARAVVAVTGEQHVVAAALGLRLLAVAGLALLVWALRRLAEAAGSGAAGALWAGALNPLVLLHLVGGAHNEALMLGLMAAGLLAFRRGRRCVGTVVLIAAVLVKAPAVVALLCAAAVSVAGCDGGWRRVRRTAGIAAVAATALVAGVFGCGQGWGWLWTLRTPAEVHTLLSLSTDAGHLLGWAAQGLGWGTAAGAMTAARLAGLLVGLGAVGYWVRCAPRAGAERATGAALLVLVAAAPVAQPWYALWAVVPLAAVSWRRLAGRGARAVVVGLTLVVMPSGQGPTWASGAAAVVGGGVALAAVLWWASKARPVPVPDAVVPRAAATTRR